MHHKFNIEFLNILETTQRMKSETTLTVESLSSIIVGNSEILQKSVNASHVAMEKLKTEQKGLIADYPQKKK